MKNNRTFLEKLLDGAEVKWKTLDEISSIYGGLTGKGKADFENGNALYVPYKNIFNNIEVDFNNLDTVNVSDDEKQYAIKYGDVLFTGSSETAEEAGMSSAVTTKTEQKIYLNSFSFGLRFNDDVELLPEFSKFLFRTLSIRKEIVKSASGVTRFNISKARFKKIKIPIPPLPVQTEIVKILDALTALTSELTSELILRQKQYEYYREKLLSFDSLEQLNMGGAKKKLIDVAKIKNGKDWKHLGEGNIPIYGSGGIMGYVDTYSYDKPTVLIPRKGTITNIFYLDEPFWNVDTIYYTEIDENQILPKYFYHFMKTVDLTKLDTGSGRPSLTQAILNEILIFVPPPEEQQRIVSILDKFETLTKSITEGLPLAIEQSQKRYEYYRELLLNFS
jgi:type I restriction enzyme specificity protein hsdS